MKNTMFPFVMLLMVTYIKDLLFFYLSFCVVSHFHQHPKEKMYEEVGDQKQSAINKQTITSKSCKWLFETSRQAVIMIQIVKNTNQSRIQKSWTSVKQRNDIYTLQTQITKKH